MTDGIHDGDPVQLSEVDTMLRAIPNEDGKDSALALEGNGEEKDWDFRLDNVTSTLRKWIDSPQTKDQVPVSALFVCDLLLEKNAKYKDAWKEFGLYSVIIDLAQKLKRLRGMTWDANDSRWKMSADEMLASIGEEGSLFDTIRDIAGYSILALALFEGGNQERLRRAHNMLTRLAV